MNAAISLAVSAALIGLVALAAPAAPAHAGIDCGEPPAARISIPDAEATDRTEMMAAIEAVRAYSAEVDAYLTCKDQRAVKVFQWMTEEQRARWEEDLSDVHARRVEVQKAMNEEIREFNELTREQTADAGDK